ncbi:MAG: uncharacterized protein JWP87_5416 [Labilithrix sp.]|nr:uncharacterized protein [Labilithrix sp.]
MTEPAGLSSLTDSLVWDGPMIALLLAFGLGQVIAVMYMATFRGLSYSRATVHAMALSSVITCMLMLAVGSSIAAGVGVAAGLSAVRFRTTLRDPRDLIFVFAALGVGMACGTLAYQSAIGGTAVFVVGSLVLHCTGYGARSQPDGLVRFIAPQGESTQEAIAKVLASYCRSFSLVTLREAAQGNAMEHAYQVSARSLNERSLMVASLQGVPGVKNVTLLLQEPTLDV